MPKEMNYVSVPLERYEDLLHKEFIANSIINLIESPDKTIPVDFLVHLVDNYKNQK